MDCGYDFESGLACSPYFGTLPDTDGILCSSDMTALSVYKYLSGKESEYQRISCWWGLTAFAWES